MQPRQPRVPDIAVNFYIACSDLEAMKTVIDTRIEGNALLNPGFALQQDRQIVDQKPSKFRGMVCQFNITYDTGIYSPHNFNVVGFNSALSQTQTKAKDMLLLVFNASDYSSYYYIDCFLRNTRGSNLNVHNVMLLPVSGPEPSQQFIMQANQLARKFNVPVISCELIEAEIAKAIDRKLLWNLEQTIINNINQLSQFTGERIKITLKQDKLVQENERTVSKTIKIIWDHIHQANDDNRPKIIYDIKELIGDILKEPKPFYRSDDTQRVFLLLNDQLKIYPGPSRDKDFIKNYKDFDYTKYTK